VECTVTLTWEGEPAARKKIKKGALYLAIVGETRCLSLGREKGERVIFCGKDNKAEKSASKIGAHDRKEEGKILWEKQERA